jgi:ketosteroid isomerase-like protein
MVRLEVMGEVSHPVHRTRCIQPVLAAVDGFISPVINFRSEATMSDALTTVQNVYAAFGRGDVPALLGLLHGDVEWQFVGDSKTLLRGAFRGHDQVAEWFGLVEQHEAVHVFKPRQFLAAIDHVTVLGFERTQALPGGGVFECEWVHVWQLREGRVARFFGMVDTEASARARP